MRRRAGLLAALALAAAPSAAPAQGSVFALRGLGWSGRPVSSRAAGTAGALAMFDPTMAANPASLTRWRSVSAWATAAPTTRTFEGPSGTAELNTVRFPLFGVAALLPPRTTIGFSISDYLDRTWTVTQRDSMVLRGQTEHFTDAGRSIGGISDVQVALAYRRHADLSFGAAFHYYLGSTRLTAQRLYDNLAYQEVLEQSQSDFRGLGVGVGMLATRGKLELSLSGRWNGTLLSTNTSGSSAETSLPLQGAIGLRWQAVPGIFLMGSAQYDAWSRADADLASTGENALDVWSVAVGAEVANATLIKLRTPLRVGYRMRRLPFTSLGEPIDEWGVAGGLGFNMGGDRATFDISIETGERAAGPAKESFNSMFVGLTIRP